MRNFIKILSTVVALGLTCQSHAQTITTIAGNGTDGYSGDNGLATAADLAYPGWMSTDASNNVYITVGNSQRIRKVSVLDTITTIAGNGVAGHSGDFGPATSATLNYPGGTAIDGLGNMYIADASNHCVRKVDASGTITTFAGTGLGGFSGDNGPASSAQLFIPAAVAVDDTGNVYICDNGNIRIRKVEISTGIITTIAGTGTTGFTGSGGPATAANLGDPRGLAVDKAGNIYIADDNNSCIWKIDPATWIITLAAGTGSAGFSGDGGPATSAKLNNCPGVAVDSAGNVYIADKSNNRIRMVDITGMITTIAGNGTAGFAGDNGPATSAELNGPYDVVLDRARNIYIGDQMNQRIRKITPLHTTNVSVPSTSTASIDVFPNPNNGFCSLMITSSKQEEVRVVISNISGRQIKNVKATTNAIIGISLDEPNGMYMISATVNGATFEKKMMLVH